jgi:outer membrane lipoprotein-sorting protein
MRRLIFLIAGLTVAASLGLAAETGKEILRRSLDLSATIQDYSADVVAVMDLPGVQVPRRTAKVYYKRPNKVAIKSRGIVMIPKRALMPGNLGTEITKDTQVHIIGKSTVGGQPLYTLKVIPTGEAAGQDRLLVWVRGDRYTVEAMDVYSGPKKELSVSWTYQLIGGRFWMPQVIHARIHGWRTREENKREGTVSVTFSNVRVNTGLSDELFKETKAK